MCKRFLIFFSMQDPHLFTMGETFPWLLLFPLLITVNLIVQQLLQEMPTISAFIGEQSSKPSPTEGLRNARGALRAEQGRSGVLTASLAQGFLAWIRELLLFQVPQ